MKYQELINTLKDEAFNVSIKEKNIFPSTIIGMCLYRYKHEYVTDDDILKKNNPFAILNPSTLETISFDSLYEGILNGIHDDFIVDAIDQDELKRIIGGWMLKQHDLSYVKSIDRIIIDLTDDQKQPFIDQYTIRKNECVILTTSSKEEVISMINKDDSLTVTNSAGKLINLKPIPATFSVSGVKDLAVNLTANTKVVCTGINMYNTPTDTKPTRCLNGVYYIYDGKEVNGMYQLCQKKIINGEDIITPLGYVKKTDLTQ